MVRKTRRALGFETLEGKLVLSHGHAAAAVAHVTKAAVLSVSGTLNGLPLPNSSTNPGEITEFTGSGSLGSMGKVKGTFSLADPFFYGKKPNLSDATLTLVKKTGTVEILIAPSKTSNYNFVIVGSNGFYSGITGSGVLKVKFSQKLFGLVQVVLHSAQR
jgi:hypothetical protein